MSRADSPRASSVWPEMPCMRGPAGAAPLREILPNLREIRTKNAARRERVLAHEWARKRLCLILGISRAEQWNGFVPPAKTPDGEPNPYASRRELIELLRDVALADQRAVEPVEDIE